MLKEVLLFQLLLFSIESFSHTYDKIKFKCDCPPDYNFCAPTFDSISLKKNFTIILCSRTKFVQEGIYLTAKGVLIKRIGSNKILFQGDDSVTYRVHSFGEKVKLSESIFSIDFNRTSELLTTIATLPFLTYTADTSGVVDTTFTFYYNKVSVEKAKDIVNLYKKDIERLKTDSTFYFNYDNQISKLLLAALNGEQDAELILYNLEVPIKGVFKGKIISRPYTTEYLLRNSIRIIKLRRTCKQQDE